MAFRRKPRRMMRRRKPRTFKRRRMVGRRRAASPRIGIRY